MKPSKEKLHQQRSILAKRIAPWSRVIDSTRPPSGWLRSIRSALGITTRQLAKLIGTNHAGVAAIERRERTGKVTLETLEKAAKAMECRLVYAFVPSAPYRTLDDILDQRAEMLARKIINRVEHSMRLERQGSPDEEIEKDIAKLAVELKKSLDGRLWSTPT